MYRAQPFSEGTVSCQHGRQLRCVGGKWEDVGSECADDDPGDAGVEVRPGVGEPAVAEPAVREGAVKQPAGPKEPNVP